MPVMTEYTWLFGASCIISVVCAFGIGANDVANSFASSVGAKALTMGQAIMVAAVMEFGGAVLLGASVTDTIKGGITKVSTFEKTPDIFLYGFMCAMIAAAFWDNFACHLSLPVSMTHTTVSATMGFALAAGGSSAVQWAPRRKTFPFFGGLAPIFMSWIITPGISGCIVVLMFFPLRAFVLRSPNSFARGLYVLPACVFLTFFVIVTFIIQTGSKNNQWKTYSDAQSVGIGAGFAAGTAIIAGLIGWLYLGPRILAESVDRKAHTAALKAIAAESGDSKLGEESEAVRRARMIIADVDAANGAGQQSAFGARLSTAWANFRATRVGDLLTNNVVSRTISYGANYKVHDHIAEDDRVAEVWQAAEVFDVDTERLFRYLQVFTACAMAFAHGSNDVANAMGPFAAVWTTWRTGKVPGSKSAVPFWILAMGGAGIVLGLATYGYKVLAVLAVRSVKLTNSRGFVVELATAMTVVLASRLGLPISTTQTVCGALLAIGLMEGSKGVNWRMAARILCGWILTILLATAVAAGFTAFGLFTPNKAASMAAAAAAAVPKA